MDQALTDLQTKLRSLFRTFNREGDPESGLYEPELAALQKTFGTDLINMLNRVLIGLAGESYPPIPSAETLSGTIFYLASNGSGGYQWNQIAVADVQAAADLVQFEADIQAAVLAQTQAIVDAISEDAPFNERYDDDTALLADLSQPDGAFGIDMTNLVIYRKSGAEGTGSWAVHSNILDAFAGTASAQDISDVNGRVDAAEQRLNAAEAVLRRLQTFHPTAAPVWDSLPVAIINQTQTGQVFDLDTYVSDADSPPENLTFTLIDALPAGFSQSGDRGEIISKVDTSIVARVDVTIRVTDESGNTADAEMRLEAYEDGNPPTEAPILASIPNLGVVEGNPIPARDHLNDIANLANCAQPVTVTATVTPAGSGYTVTGNSRGGTATPGAVGTYQVITRAEADDGQFQERVSQFTITEAPAPTFAQPPNRVAAQGAAAIVVDLGQFLSDPNTPNSELAPTLVVNGGPGAVGVSGLVLSIPTSQAGNFRMTATVTNRAGKSASRSFDITIYVIGGGSTGGGGGGGTVVIQRY